MCSCGGAGALLRAGVADVAVALAVGHVIVVATVAVRDAAGARDRVRRAID
jgi:hypothetical protein